MESLSEQEKDLAVNEKQHFHGSWLKVLAEKKFDSVDKSSTFHPPLPHQLRVWSQFPPPNLYLPHLLCCLQSLPPLLRCQQISPPRPSHLTQIFEHKFTGQTSSLTPTPHPSYIPIPANCSPAKIVALLEDLPQT